MANIEFGILHYTPEAMMALKSFDEGDRSEILKRIDLAIKAVRINKSLPGLFRFVSQKDRNRYIVRYKNYRVIFTFIKNDTPILLDIVKKASNAN